MWMRTTMNYQYANGGTLTNALQTLYKGAFYTLVPIRPRSRGERRSLRTFPVASLRPPVAFNPRPRHLSTPTDAYELHPDVRSNGTTQRGRDPSLLPRRLVRDHSEPAVAIRRHRGEHWHPRRARRAVPEHAHRAADRVRVLGRRLVAHRAHAGGHVQGASHLTRTGPRTTASAR